jgi:ParB/Sulfiredoxin domain
MATITAQVGRQVALDQIRVPENVRTLDEAHVQALAGSIKLQGILVPLVVRDDGDVFELVAGFHRVAAAKSVGLAEVPVVVREAQTEDADRAVENITSCRRRHDVIYADRVVIPMSELTCATVRREPAGEVGIRTRTDPGSRLRHTIWLKWRLPLDSESEHAIRTRRHARDSSGASVWGGTLQTLASSTGAKAGVSSSWRAGAGRRESPSRKIDHAAGGSRGDPR